MRSLSTIGQRSLRRRPGRFALTAAGTAFGVAVLFAVLVATGATNDALNRDLKGSVGTSDVFVSPVGSYDAVVPSKALTKIRAFRDVERISPYLSFRSSLQNPRSRKPVPPGSRDNIVFVVGVDLAIDREITTYALSDGRFFKEGADEIVVSRSLADRRDLRVGDGVLVATPSGLRPVTITGVLADVGAGVGNQGNSTYTSLATARRLDGKGDVLSGLAVVLADGVDRTAWIDEQRATLGDALAIQDADDIAAGFKMFIAAISTALTLISAVAVFVGGFLVFLTFSVAVAERTRMYGTLRALGAVPRQVRRVVLVEAATLGFVASLVGLVFGYGLAKAAVGLTGNLFDLNLPPLGIPIGQGIFSVALGVTVSLVAAWIPGRRAAQLSPIAAMREGAAAQERRGRLWWRIAIFVIGAAIVLATPPTGARGLAVIMVLLGAVVLVPFALNPVARVLGRVTSRAARGVGSIAVLHLVKERSRSAYTLALVMVIIAMLIATAGTNIALANTLDDIIERQAGGSVQAFAPGAVDPKVANELAAVPGAKTVSPIRVGQTEILGKSKRQIGVTLIEPASYFTVAGFAWVDGDDDTAKQALAKGGAVLLPDGEAQRGKLELGDSVRVRTGAGVRSFRLAGTYAIIGPGFGAVVGDVDARLFDATRVNGFLIGAAKGVDPERLRADIAASVGKKYDLVLDTPESTKRYAFNQLQGFFSLAYVVLAIAAITGMLGLGNTLAVSVLSRTREIGMLRSTGALRRQVRGMVLVEAATLALVAFVLAVPLGFLLLRGIISAQRAGLGVTVHQVFPWAFVIPLGVLALAVAALASLFPARSAGRLEPVAALRFD